MDDSESRGFEEPPAADATAIERDERLAERTEHSAVVEAVDDLPSTGLLSFYDRLRERILDGVERRGGNLGAQVADVLLVVPDVFMLLVRLSLDREVPKSTRALLASSLAYFVLPVDLLPEAIVGPAGYVDDLVLALTVLSHAFGDELEPWTDKYWSGSKRLRFVVRDVLDSAKGLLGNRIYDRIGDLLAKKGIDLERTARRGGDDLDPEPYGA